MNDRRLLLLNSLALGLIASGCANKKPVDDSIPRKSVAILGVVQQPGLSVPVNESRLATDLGILLREEQRYAVMPYNQVRLAIGANRQDLLMRRLANAGQMDDIDLEMLKSCLLYTSPSPRDRTRSRMPSSA